MHDDKLDNNGHGEIEKDKKTISEKVNTLFEIRTISLLTLSTLSNEVRKKGIQGIKDCENWISSNLVSIFFFIPYREKENSIDACCLPTCAYERKKDIS